MATPRGDHLRRDPDFRSLKAAVIDLTGLGYWSDKDDILADRLAGLIRHGGDSAASLVGRLNAEAGSGPASDAIIDVVTVGETSFFRYQAQFDALERVIFPELLARNRWTRSLSLWSAGCSNGAEAYSLNMLLRRRFAVPLAGWHIDIVGTDINTAALAEARGGEYGAWTIRDLADDLRRDGFCAHGGRWRVRPPFREGIRFVRHNLVHQPPPGHHFDLVMCRNVLMYFCAEARSRALWSLRAGLAPGGWLLVGHAETGPPVSDLFAEMVLPDCTLYRKPLGEA